MNKLILIYFAGCPHAEQARDVLRQSGRPFREVCQDDLPAQHPYLAYTSPTILEGSRVLFGAATEAAGCTAEPPEPRHLLAVLRHAPYAD